MLSVFYFLYHFKFCGFLASFATNLDNYCASLMKIPKVKSCCEKKTNMGISGIHRTNSKITGS